MEAYERENADQKLECIFRVWPRVLAADVTKQHPQDHQCQRLEDPGQAADKSVQAVVNAFAAMSAAPLTPIHQVGQNHLAANLDPSQAQPGDRGTHNADGQVGRQCVGIGAQPNTIADKAITPMAHNAGECRW